LNFIIYVIENVDLGNLEYSKKQWREAGERN